MTWCTSSQVSPQVKRRGRSWIRNPEYVSTRHFIRQWLVKTTLGKNKLVPTLGFLAGTGYRLQTGNPLQ